MVGKVVIGALVGVLISVGTSSAQQVEVPREKAGTVVQSAKRPAAQPAIEVRPQAVAIVETSHSPPPKLSIEQMRQAGALAAQKVREENHDIETDAGPPDSPAPQPKKQISANAVRAVDRQSRESEPPPPAQSISFSSQTAFARLADGFDLPVGKPDGRGYYKARGMRAHGHLGEDWDGVGGGDTDLGDPVYCIGDGVVVFARDCHQGWGNVIIVRHAYREGGSVRNVDSLYGHLDKILVHRGQAVRRGQHIAAIGNAHGLYDAHLHLEVRKNIAIGMSRDKFAQDFSNYYDPSEFIASHRHLQTSGASYRIAMNTFTYDSRIHWDQLRNYSHARTGDGSSESAYALKKAVASQSATAH
jgi:murein DD-endopeptidase MepM/ murein hydrolase activator NlpD